MSDDKVCEDCAEVVEESHACPYCGGVTLDLQEAGDKILQLKSDIRRAIDYDEGC